MRTPRLPFTPACVSQGYRRRHRRVKRAYPPGQRDVGGRVAGGQQRGGAAVVLVADRDAHVTAKRRLVQRAGAGRQLHGDDTETRGGRGLGGRGGGGLTLPGQEAFGAERG